MFLKKLNENVKYIRHYGINSLSIRYFITIFLILLVPFMAISYLVYQNNKNAIDEEMAAASYAALGNIQQATDSSLDEINRLGHQILASDHVELFAKLPFERLISYDRMRMIQSMQNNLSITSATYEFMDEVHVYFPNSDFIISPGSTNPIKHVRSLVWMDGYDHDTIKNSWFIETIDGNERLIHTIKLYFDNDYYTMVIFIMDLERLMNTVLDVEHADFQLMVTEGSEIIYENQGHIGEGYLEAFFEGKLIPIGDAYYMTEEGQPSVLSKIDSVANHWSYISIVSVDAYQDIQRSYTAFMMLLGASLLTIAVVSSLLITIRSVSPINRIMALVEDKHINKDPASGEGSGKGINELKYILQAIKETNIQRIEMSEELEHRYEALRNAKKIALQSQINPHFLFNSLESINWKVLSLTMGENEASQMIQQLSKLMEFSLETGSNFISIDDEVEHAKLYIDFQMHRYKNSFNAVYDIDTECKGYCCISLMLQPIIENAIYHGIKPCPRENILRVKAYIDGEDVIFEVTDDGIGISRSRIKALKEDLTLDVITEDHIGLANVNQRLKLIFGDHYGIDLESEPGRYTKVKISIPKVEIENLS